MNTRKQAQDAIANGLGIIPTKDKRPSVSQDKPITEHNTTLLDSYWYASRAEMPAVGVVAEVSGLMFLDIDVKNDVNGFVTLENAGLEIPETPVSYKSTSGKGAHYWYRAPSESLGKVTSHANIPYIGHKLAGVDNRVGNGYVVLPADFEIPSREVLESLPLAPEWLWKESVKTEASEATKYDGDHTEWLDNLVKSTDGEMSPDVQNILSRIPFMMDHDIMRNLQCALVKEGAKGSKGSATALATLRSAFLRNEFNTPEYQREWDNALQGAIEKYGTFSEELVDQSSLDKYFAMDSKGKRKQFKAHTFATDLAEDTAIDGAGAFWSYENGVWNYNKDTHIKTLTSTFGDSYQISWSTLVHDHLKSILALEGKVILDEPDKYLINVQNGMYNWKTGHKVDHDQKYLSTVQLNVSYDPSATCPNFDKWLSETLPGDEQLGLEVIGYMMMSGNPFHTVPLLVGSGRNGKSTYLRIIEKMIGDRNISGLDLNQLSTDKFAPVAMYGKLANICPDIHQKHLSNTGMLKRVTGGDSIQGERKGQDSFQFTPWATLIFSTNELWSSSDTSDAYFERWLPIPFNQKFSANGTFDENILYSEMNGIFNKAMAALRNLHKNHGFSKSDSQKKLEAEFLLSADPVMQWLSDPDYVTIANPEETNVSIRSKKTDLFISYQAYRKGRTNGLDRKKFYESLEKKGYKKINPGNVEHFVGIQTKSIDMFGEVSSYDPQVTIKDYTNNF
jgi:P4 family phage/plasmid primase-like protien